MCEQPQQGARDIWTQIYPIEHTGDRRRAIVPKWLLNAANHLNVAALPEGRPALLDRGTGSLAGGGRRRPQQLSRLFALQPGESAGGREWVSSTPARTEEADRPQHLLLAVLATSELMLHPVNRMSWLHESHRADNR